MAPELLGKQTGGRHTDWWAVGVVCFEMLTGESPWSSCEDMALLQRDIQSQAVVTPHDTSQELHELYMALLTLIEKKVREQLLKT